MKWTTPVSFSPGGNLIKNTSSVLSVGSCFSENIGNKLKLGGITTEINPFGVSYNVESIFNQLHQIAHGGLQRPNRWFTHNGLWHSKDHHGSFSRESREELETAITQRQLGIHPIKKDLTHILITPGTAFKWVEKSTGETVNNCHKRPSSEFDLVLLNPNSIVEQFDEIYKAWPGVEFWFSISPVRHLKNGLIQNQKSKSTLILALHEIVNKYENARYFPAYEILVDELRDYRFYDSDLLHPSKEAIEEIWDRFTLLLSKDTQNMCNASEKVRKLYKHRTLHPNQEVKRKHKASVDLAINKWEDQYKRNWPR